MSRCKLSNRIFELGLDAQEMSVYAYLCSIHSGQRTVTGEKVVCVKQSTIAQNCGIRASRTAARILSRLFDKGLAEPLERSVKANRHKGTYSYAVRILPYDGGWFFADRHIFGQLVPRQIMIYLFLCKAYSTRLHDSWNSYNDISRQTGMKRETVIRTVKELEEKKFILRCRRKSRINNRVFADNHYHVIFFLRGSFRQRKKIVRLHSKYNRTNQRSFQTSKRHYYHTTFLRKCQALSHNFFTVRGSPSDASHI